VLNIAVAKHDQALAVVGKEGYVARFQLPSFKLLNQSTYDHRHDKWGDYRAIDFVHDQ
jgi:hypothetical protein